MRASWRPMASVTILVVALLMQLATAPCAQAQPGERRGPRPDDARQNSGRPDRPAPKELESPDALRERLGRVLDRLREQESKLEDAIARLEAGEDPRDIMADQMGREGAFRDRPDSPRAEGQEPDRRPRREQVSEAELDRVEAFLKEQVPEVAARFAEERRTRSMRTRFMAHRLLERLDEIESMRQRDPALAELNVRETRLAISLMHTRRTYSETYRRSGEASPDLAPLESELRLLVREQRQLKLEMRAHEIERLTARLDAMRQEIAKDRNAGDQEADQIADSIIEDLKNDTGPDERPRRRPR